MLQATSTRCRNAARCVTAFTRSMSRSVSGGICHFVPASEMTKGVETMELACPAHFEDLAVMFGVISVSLISTGADESCRHAPLIRIDRCRHIDGDARNLPSRIDSFFPSQKSYRASCGGRNVIEPARSRRARISAWSSRLKSTGTSSPEASVVSQSWLCGPQASRMSNVKRSRGCVEHHSEMPSAVAGTDQVCPLYERTT